MRPSPLLWLLASFFSCLLSIASAFPALLNTRTGVVIPLPEYLPRFPQDSVVARRYRRSQPGDVDYTDEFSIDPFESRQKALKKLLELSTVSERS